MKIGKEIFNDMQKINSLKLQEKDPTLLNNITLKQSIYADDHKAFNKLNTSEKEEVLADNFPEDLYEIDSNSVLFKALILYYGSEKALKNAMPFNYLAKNENGAKLYVVGGSDKLIEQDLFNSFNSSKNEVTKRFLHYINSHNN